MVILNLGRFGGFWTLLLGEHCLELVLTISDNSVNFASKTAIRSIVRDSDCEIEMLSLRLIDSKHFETGITSHSPQNHIDSVSPLSFRNCGAVNLPQDG